MLTNENYFAPESSQSYMSVSQFKSFLDCEARTMAELNGEYHKMANITRQPQIPF